MAAIPMWFGGNTAIKGKTFFKNWFEASKWSTIIMAKMHVLTFHNPSQSQSRISSNAIYTIASQFWILCNPEAMWVKTTFLCFEPLAQSYLSLFKTHQDWKCILWLQGDCAISKWFQKNYLDYETNMLNSKGLQHRRHIFCMLTEIQISWVGWKERVKLFRNFFSKYTNKENSPWKCTVKGWLAKGRQ